MFWVSFCFYEDYRRRLFQNLLFVSNTSAILNIFILLSSFSHSLSICTYTVAKERVAYAAACNPSFVNLMIGTNDIKGIYIKEWGDKSRETFRIPENISYKNFAKNFDSILEQLLKNTEAFIAVNTLPPMGENLECEANKCIRAANSLIKKSVIKAMETKAGKERIMVVDVYGALAAHILEHKTERQRKISLKVDEFGEISIKIAFKSKIFGVGYNECSEKYGLSVLLDALHLNDTGAMIVADKVSEWMTGIDEREEKGRKAK